MTPVRELPPDSNPVTAIMRRGPFDGYTHVFRLGFYQPRVWLDHGVVYNRTLEYEGGHRVYVQGVEPSDV